MIGSTQFRCAIFFLDEAQQEIAEKANIDLDGSNKWSNPIVTEVVAIEKFYPAENDHLDYFTQNGNQPYCSFRIRPKVEKFKEKYASLLK
jgi:peptide-methionine (S)-S-oxide reductase